MSNPKLAWVVCIMAALSLGGCAVDATGTDALGGEDEASVAQWYLTNGAEAPEGDDDGSVDEVDGVDDDVDSGQDDDFVAAEMLGDEYSEQYDPHPDPWEWHEAEETAGTGNKD